MKAHAHSANRVKNLIAPVAACMSGRSSELVLELIERRTAHQLTREELQTAFCAQVAAAFKGLWSDVSCALLPEADAGIAIRYQAHAAERFGSLFGGYMRSWYLQAAQFTRANAFRRMVANGPHHFIVRARFELHFGSMVKLRALPTRPPAVYALSYVRPRANRPIAVCSNHFSDAAAGEAEQATGQSTM